MTIRHDESARWSELCQFSIDVSRDGTAWHAGRTQDVLTVSTTTVVAATTGGVWVVERSGNNAYPVSDTWPAREVMSLCKSPLSEEHLFACSQAPIQLYETSLASNKPLYVWQSVPLPASAGIATVYCAATTRNAPFRLVIATNVGVFWSPLGAPGGYSWTQAVWINAQNLAQPFTRDSSGVAAGKDCILVAPRNTTDVVFRAAWDAQDRLIVQSVPIPSPGPSGLPTLGWLTVASCTDVPSTSYMLSFDQSGKIFGVLKSTKDGTVWTWCSFDLDTGETLANAGGDITAGGPVKHVSVDSHNPSKVSIVGIQGYVSITGGDTWHNIQNPHSDLHTIYFDPLDITGQTLLSASDGGVFLSSDGGKKWDSRLNKNVRTLQCYTPGHVRGFWGCMDVFESPREGSWVATGLQDNGNVILSQAMGNQARWLPFGRGDGGYCRFLPSGSVVYSGVSDKGLNAQVASRAGHWNGWDIPDAAPGAPLARSGLPGPRLYTFRKPWHGPANMDSAMFGVATSDSEPGKLFGLFGSGQSGEVTHWNELCVLDLAVATTNDTITAFAEAGGVLWAATARGRLFSFAWDGNYPISNASVSVRGIFVPNPPTAIYEYPYVLGGRADALPPDVPRLGFVSLCVEPGSSDLWAIVDNVGPSGNFQSKIFRTQSTSWKEYTLNLADSTGFGPRLQAVYADRRTVFTVGDGAVYRLEPAQDEWVDISSGLPKAFQGSDLAEWTATPTSILLLSTFDRGVWQLSLP